MPHVAALRSQRSKAPSKMATSLTWPGIENINFGKHLPLSLATTLGHLDQEQKNVQSTKLANKPHIPEEIHFFPTPEKPNVPSHHCFELIESFIPKHTAYGDLTGRFPHTSSRGNKYLFIVYDYESNAILCKPLKNRTAGEIKTAWEAVHSQLSLSGSQPGLYILDNKASFELKRAMKKNNLDFQLVPPHIHRRNAAERAIRTFKNNFLSVLATANPQFPMSEWDRLLPQTKLTLNLLRNSCTNPKLSAYAFLNGNFDFNKTPMAPAGTRVVVHTKPDKRSTFGYHGEQGCHVGPSLEHYRCMKCFITSTCRVRDADTLQFFPKVTPFPKTSADECVHKPVRDLLSLLSKPLPTLPYLEYGDQTQNSLHQIAALLGRATILPNPVLSLPSKTSAKTPLVAYKHDSFFPLRPTTRPLLLSTAKNIVPTPRVHNIDSDPPPRVQHTIPTPIHTPITRSTTRLVSRFLCSSNPVRITQQSNHTYEVPVVNHIYHPTTSKKETIDTLLQGSDSTVWSASLSNELGRLAQGINGRVTFTNTIYFIPKHQVPLNKKVTYVNFVCDYKPLKTETNRICLTVGGDLLPC